MSKDTGDRLREVADCLYGGNKSELARDLGMKPPSFSKYTSGSTLPGASVLRKLSELGINPTWILTGKGEMTMSDESKGSPVVVQNRELAYELENAGLQLQRVPELRVEVEAGDGLKVYASDEVEEQEQWLSRTFIRREYNVDPERVRTLRVRGNSMYPTIEPGDRIRVALWDGENLWEGNIYVLHSPAGLTIKRWGAHRNGHVVLHADNPDVEDRTISRDRWDEDWRPVAWALEVTQPL